MANKFFFLFLFSWFLLVCCNNNKTIDSPKMDPEAIYFDYRVWGEEENGEVTVRLQYFMGNLERNTILWKLPAKVELDNEILQADSSKMNGFYYEARIPLENFVGTHHIVFTDRNNKQYKEEFKFSVFSLKNEIPQTFKRQELILELAGIDSGEIVKVLITDTSFYGRGVEKVDSMWNDSIVITPRDLENLKDGPVFLEIYKDTEWPLKEPGRGGGKLSVSYGIRRAFELKD